ncbi:MAG: oxidoreductase [Pseudomonadota bacterium]|nr:oxidoreductase [Xanthomonadaceae bacterium]MDE3210111.1 oxidoreductase [Pseudomonadota bacterium]
MSSTNSPPLPVGLIGYGYAGKTFHAPLIQATPGLALAAVACSDADRVHRDLPGVEVIADAAQLIASANIALVVIASPNASHAGLAQAALAAGKHVVVDKPFTLDVAEARALLAQAEQAGRQLSVFQNRRWDSDFLAVKQAIERGAVGNVRHFESHFDRYRPLVRARWREQAVPGAGIWYDLGPHLVDQALQLFGLPQRVTATLAIQRADGEVADWAHVLLDYGSAQVILHASMLVAGGSVRFIVHGDRGSLCKRGADRQETQLLAGMTPGTPGWGEDPDPLLVFAGEQPAQSVGAPAGDYRHYYAGIRDAVAGRAANPVPPIQALAVMAVLEAALASSREGCARPLPLTAAECAAWRRQR